MTRWKLARFATVALLAGAFAFALVACGGDDDDDGNGGGNDTATPTSSNGGNGDDHVTEITITMTDNKFEPAEFSVHAGDEVTVTVKNDGKAVHNMHVLSSEAEGQDYTSAQVVNPGKEDSFVIKFTKAGTIDFQCDYHLPDMVGTITVEE